MLRRKVSNNIVVAGLLAIILGCSNGAARTWQNLPSPEVGEIWSQPVQGQPAQPVWGHAKGMRVGIAPMPGPRGLLRIYTPYLGHKEGKMMNFIAIEPIAVGEKHRGFSELEMSELDDRRGKRFWSSDDSLSSAPHAEDLPARGVITEIGGSETLTVFIFCEPFDNGAKVYVRLRFFEHRPYEVELTAYAQEDSRQLDNFILTATMGNYARLRTLYLDDTIKSSPGLWPRYTDSNFAPHDYTAVTAMIKDEFGTAYFVAAPDEAEPQGAVYAPGTNDHWKYYGRKATQYWCKKNPGQHLQGVVNGRYTYWGSKSPIPGGISFENFELKAPFENGAEYVFGITPQRPDEFIKEVKEK